MGWWLLKNVDVVWWKYIGQQTATIWFCLPCPPQVCLFVDLFVWQILGFRPDTNDVTPENIPKITEQVHWKNN